MSGILLNDKLEQSMDFPSASHVQVAGHSIFILVIGVSNHIQNISTGSVSIMVASTTNLDVMANFVICRGKDFSVCVQYI
jgi:hypothetical protein